MLCQIFLLVTILTPNVLPRPIDDDDVVAGGGVIAGGQQKMDQSDPKVKEQLKNLTTFAVKTMDAKSNDLYHGQMVRISDAKYQIVQGAIYEITFYIGQTKCSKNKDGNLKFESGNCLINEDGTYQKCTVKIWEKQWEDFLELEESKCSKVAKTEALKNN